VTVLLAGVVIGVGLGAMASLTVQRVSFWRRAHRRVEVDSTVERLRRLR